MLASCVVAVPATVSITTLLPRRPPDTGALDVPLACCLAITYYKRLLPTLRPRTWSGTVCTRSRGAVPLRGGYD